MLQSEGRGISNLRDLSENQTDPNCVDKSGLPGIRQSDLCLHINAPAAFGSELLFQDHLATNSLVTFLLFSCHLGTKMLTRSIEIQWPKSEKCHKCRILFAQIYCNCDHVLSGHLSSQFSDFIIQFLFFALPVLPILLSCSVLLHNNL